MFWPLRCPWALSYPLSTNRGYPTSFIYWALYLVVWDYGPYVVVGQFRHHLGQVRQHNFEVFIQFEFSAFSFASASSFSFCKPSKYSAIAFFLSFALYHRCQSAVSISGGLEEPLYLRTLKPAIVVCSSPLRSLPISGSRSASVYSLSRSGTWVSCA